MHCELIPGPALANAREALETIADGSTRVRGAVAFLTFSGVSILGQLAERRPNLEVSVIVRGAPITDPQALVALDELGVTVSIVCGRRAAAFHPKLWLGDGRGDLHVLSGSGNATEGGLAANDEQFEYLVIPTGRHDLIDAHEQRFAGFRDLGVPLPAMIGTTFWGEWERQAATRAKLRAQARELDERLYARGESSVVDALLYEDLRTLFERTKAEVTIPDGKGGRKPYRATRFKQAIDRARKDGTLVRVLANMVKGETEGLEHLAEEGRPDLMVETVVTDTSRPYHFRFSAEMKNDAQANLDDYHRRTNRR